jgi:hypothetical protein
MVTCLCEKLSDSKVVIRQAVLKCCSLLITGYKPSTFAFHAMKYLQHGNWHVREGALQLIAHCLISQIDSALDTSEQSITLNPTLLATMCETA